MFKARFFNARNVLIVSFEVGSMAQAQAWAREYNREPHVALGKCELIGNASKPAHCSRIAAVA